MTGIDEKGVLKALEGVTDFERGADVVSLGMISGLAIAGGRVHFAIEVDSKRGQAQEPLRSACERAVRALPGVDSVSAVLTAHREAPGPAGDATGDSEIVAQVIEALKTVYDPEIPVSIYDLGLVYRVHVDAESNVDIEMTLTTMGCPVADSLPGEVENAVRMGVPDAREVRVVLVWDPPWTMERMSEAARLEIGFL